MITKYMELGDKIELISKSSKKEDKQVYVSKIQNFDEDGNITILAPIHQAKIVPLGINTNYYVFVYTSKGLYSCETVVSSRSKSENMYFITLKVLTKMKKFQRRQYYRLDCILPFSYNISEEEEEWTKATILDISGGGIRFSAEEKLERNTPIECHLKLDLDDEIKEIYVSGEIVGSKILENEKDLFENRVEFEDISNEYREIIIKYIFEEERKRRKKEKGM